MRAASQCAAVLVVAGLAAACSGVGIVASDDPYVKIRQADELWSRQGRAGRARQQLDEAIAIFEQRGDKVGLAEAYRSYAFLARNGGARPDVILIRTGAAPGMPSREDLARSDEYFARAAALAAEADRPDLLSNINFNLGVNRVAAGEPGLACPFYDRALADSREFAAQRPGAKVDLPRGVGSFTELVAQAKAEAGCPRG